MCVLTLGNQRSYTHLHKTTFRPNCQSNCVDCPRDLSVLFPCQHNSFRVSFDSHQSFFCILVSNKARHTHIVGSRDIYDKIEPQRLLQSFIWSTSSYSFALLPAIRPVTFTDCVSGYSEQRQITLLFSHLKSSKDLDSIHDRYDPKQLLRSFETQQSLLGYSQVSFCIPVSNSALIQQFRQQFTTNNP